VTIDALDYGDRYDLDEGRGRHPLLDACVDEVGVPEGLDVVVAVRSGVPPGASTGTSAAVAVAMVAALSALRGEGATRRELAARAWRAEHLRAGRQSGVQDQLAAAHGGVNRIVITGFPHDVDVVPVGVPPAARAELERRLVLVLLGRSHVSAAVHESVIAHLEGASADEVAARLDPLRAAAQAGARALAAGDLEGYGRALVANTEGQRALHPGLVGREATAVIEAATRAGAVGWKVNGAGGEGGSLALLAGSGVDDRRELVATVEAAVPGARAVPTTFDDDGVRVEPIG
jgi:D-glycero-alpha-D-manno-heptose-7-phosphate kinase